MPLRSTVLLLSLLVAVVVQVDARLGSQPLLEEEEDDVIPGEFIVIYKAASSDDFHRRTRDLIGDDEAVIDAFTSFPGVLVSGLYKEPTLDRLLRSQDVALVEPNRRIQVKFVDDDEGNDDKERTLGQMSRTSTKSWGLERVRERNNDLNGSFRASKRASTGRGVTAYVVDSGIRLGHSEFTGRARCGYTDFYGDECVDESGHGTFVAGVLGGATVGVAPGVTNIIAVKVLDQNASGNVAGAIRGLEWVYDHAEQRTSPAVVNFAMSLTKRSEALDIAINRLVSIGVSVVVSAGNDGINNCMSSPLTSKAIKVGGTNGADKKPAWSNFGPCLTVFAPATNIVSSFHQNNGDYQSRSGTTAAAPHVAGAVAVILERWPKANPVQLQQTIIRRSTKGVLSDIGQGSPNRLLYVW